MGYKIYIDDETEGSEFNEAEDITILGHLEKRDAEIYYRCGAAHCGVCRLKLLEGTVKNIRRPIAFAREGEFFTCSTVPLSDIRIETYKFE
jgi:ferredoxin